MHEKKRGTFSLSHSIPNGVRRTVKGEIWVIGLLYHEVLCSKCFVKHKDPPQIFPFWLPQCFVCLFVLFSFLFSLIRRSLGLFEQIFSSGNTFKCTFSYSKSLLLHTFSSPWTWTPEPKIPYKSNRGQGTKKEIKTSTIPTSRISSRLKLRE